MLERIKLDESSSTKRHPRHNLLEKQLVVINYFIFDFFAVFVNHYPRVLEIPLIEIYLLQHRVIRVEVLKNHIFIPNSQWLFGAVFWLFIHVLVSYISVIEETSLSYVLKDDSAVALHDDI